MKKIYFAAFMLCAGGWSFAQELSINEFGQILSGTTSEASSRPVVNDDSTLWEQAVSTSDNKYAIVSTYYIPDGWGLYSADDFKAEKDITINSLLFYGSQSNDDAQELIEKVNLYIYTNANGVPAGSPEDQGSELAKFSFDYNQLTVEPGEDAFMGNKIYHLDIKSILGEGIQLEAGHYWLSIVFDINMDSGNFDDRFSWSDSETLLLNQPKAISSELGITSWKSVPEIGFPVKAFAFSLYGEEEILSTFQSNLENLQIYPNPATDVFYLSGSSVQQVQKIMATNTVGQSFELNYRNGQADVSNLAKGVYIINIKTSEGSISRKIIKK